LTAAQLQERPIPTDICRSRRWCRRAPLPGSTRPLTEPLTGRGALTSSTTCTRRCSIAAGLRRGV